MTRTALPLSLALLGVLLTTGPRSWARSEDDALAVAQRHVDVAEERFRAADYLAAAEAFLAAEAALVGAGLAVPPILYRSAARAHELQGSVGEALTYYERFLDEARSDDGRLAPVIDEARDARTRLRASIERTAVTLQIQPAHASVRIDGQPVWDPGPLAVAPGTHRILIEAPGYQPAELELEVPAGSRLPIVVWMRPLHGDPAGVDAALALAGGWVTGEGYPWTLGGLGAIGLSALTSAALLYSSASDLRAGADGLASRAYPADEADGIRSRVAQDYGSAAMRDDFGTGLVVTGLAAAAGAAWLWWRVDGNALLRQYSPEPSTEEAGSGPEELARIEPLVAAEEGQR